MRSFIVALLAVSITASAAQAARNPMCGKCGVGKYFSKTEGKCMEPKGK